MSDNKDNLAEESSIRVSDNASGSGLLINKFERLVEEIEGGGSQMSATLRTVYDSDEQQEFELALEQRLRQNEKEIERMCNKNYQGFIDALSKLNEVKEDASQLQNNISKLNKANQQSGNNVIKKFSELEQGRMIQRNILYTIENVNYCIPALEMYCRLLDQMDKKQHYGALKTLEHLEHVALPKISMYTFSSRMMEAIPEIRSSIKKRSKADIKDFLEKVREKSEYIGEVAMHQILRHSNLEISEKVSERITALHEQESELCAQDLLNFSPVYKCLHIYSVLGSRDEFESYYREQRHRQARLVLQQRHGQWEESIQSFKSYFFQIAGFFVVEDTVLHTTQCMVVSNPSVDLWGMAINKIIAVLRAHSTTCREIPMLLHLKELVVWFSWTMKSYGYAVDRIYELLIELREMYIDILSKEFADNFVMEFSKANYTPMSVTTEGQYQRICSQLNVYEPELERAPFPKIFAFSELVLKTFSLFKSFVLNCNSFSDKLNLSQTDIDDKVRKAVNQLFQRTLSSQLSLIVRNDRLQIQQLAQIYVDLKYLEKSCVELSKYITMVTHTKREGSYTIRMIGAQILGDTTIETEKQIMQKLCQKLSQFMESADYIWTTKAPVKTQASRYIEDALHYLKTLLETFALLPIELSSKLCLTACKHLNAELMNIITSDEVQAISMNWFRTFDIDLTACEELAISKEVKIFNISQSKILEQFASLRQLVRLAFSEDWFEYISDYENNGSKYSDLQPSDLHKVLKKVINSEIAQKGKGRSARRNPADNAKAEHYDLICVRVSDLKNRPAKKNEEF